MFGDALRARVDPIKRRSHVEVVVPKRRDDLVKVVFECVEIAEEPIGIERVTRDGCGDLPVVAMNRFSRSPNHDGMGGAELRVN